MRIAQKNKTFKIITVLWILGLDTKGSLVQKHVQTRSEKMSAGENAHTQVNLEVFVVVVIAYKYSMLEGQVQITLCTLAAVSFARRIQEEAEEMTMKRFSEPASLSWRFALRSIKCYDTQNGPLHKLHIHTGSTE